jgi:UDP-glucose 4-epimerase
MLLDAMKAHKVKILIYSSARATYGEPKRDANHRRYTAGQIFFSALTCDWKI